MTALKKASLTDSFDGLRGILAVWVLLSHVSQFVDGPGGIIKKGGIAVDLFMFVSGFLMVWTVMSREAKEPTHILSTWRKFLTRRVFRIAPLYFLALLIAFAFDDYYSGLLVDVYSAIGQGFERPFRECRFSLPIDAILHFSFLYGLVPCSAASNVLPDWSLSLEMQFYLLFPLLFLALTSTRGIILALFCLIIAAVSQNVVSVYLIDPSKIISFPQPSILPLRINCFIGGMALAALVWRQAKDVCLLAVVILTTVFFQRLTFVAIAMLFSFMIIARSNLWVVWTSKYLFPLRVIDWVLTLRPLRFLGDISFGIYLIHLLLLLPVVVYFNGFDWFIEASGGVKFGVLSLATLPPIVWFSWQLHRMIEVPMIAAGRKITA